MSQSDWVRAFDEWAPTYDASVTAGQGEFPFDGYHQVLDVVVRMADVEPPLRILDLGTGTGNLTQRFVRAGCAVWGLDFSPAMLALAHTKVPEAHFVCADLQGEWPAEFRQPFERVVSAYVLHHFDLDTKLRLLERIARDCLAPGGRIVVADIAFPTVADRAEAARRLPGAWDEDEFPWAADETIAALAAADLHATYEQVSSCGGAFTITLKSTCVA